MATGNEIGRRIKGLREKKGLTQQQLAKELHVKRETVNLWENGMRDLKTGYTIALADYFEVDCDYLLRGISAKRADIHEATGLDEIAIASIDWLKHDSPVGAAIMNSLYTDTETMTEIAKLVVKAIYFRNEAKTLRIKGETTPSKISIGVLPKKVTSVLDEFGFFDKADDMDMLFDLNIYKAINSFEKSLKNVIDHFEIDFVEEGEDNE